jgi:hypothetical protein
MVSRRLAAAFCGFSFLLLLAVAPWQAAPRKNPLDSLEKGLLDIDGCLGVKNVSSADGQSAIFAWFRDLEACLDWYYHEAHQGAIRMLISEDLSPQSEPLEHLDDDCGPILAIASITPARNATVPGVDLPIQQISIELYTPLPGGISVGGRFAPATLEIPHHRDLPLDPAEEDA